MAVGEPSSNAHSQKRVPGALRLAKFDAQPVNKKRAIQSRDGRLATIPSTDPAPRLMRL